MSNVFWDDLNKLATEACKSDIKAGLEVCGAFTRREALKHPGNATSPSQDTHTHTKKQFQVFNKCACFWHLENLEKNLEPNP